MSVSMLLAAALPVVLAVPWSAPAPPPAYPTTPTSTAWGGPPPSYPTQPTGWGGPPPGYPSAVTTAQPPLYSIINSAECLAVQVVADALGLLATPTQFCSSYLSIPTITSSVVSTCTEVVPVVSTSFVSTATVTVAETATATVTSTSTTFTSTETDISTITAATVTAATVTVSTCSGTTVAPTAARKRGAGTAVVRAPAPVVQRGGPLLGGLLGGILNFPTPEISTACLCLDIPTPTWTAYGETTTTSTSTSVISLTAITTTTVTLATTTATVTSTEALVSTITSTTTATATVTPSTTTESCPAPTECGNQGLQFAVYPNTDGQNSATGYPSFNPQGYKDVTPECTGTTSTIGGFNFPTVGAINVYGQCPLAQSDFFVVNHRGYIFAQQTGVYSFTTTKVDDIVEVWVGATAFSGWTRANANLNQVFGQAAMSYTVPLQAGTYTPVRIVFGQAQGAASFTLTVTAPDGSTFLGPDTEASPFLVQRSCDGVTAPPFAPFGQET